MNSENINNAFLKDLEDLSDLEDDKNNDEEGSYSNYKSINDDTNAKIREALKILGGK